MKKVIRLNENELHNLIKETVKRVLKENYEEDTIILEDFSNSILNVIRSLNLKREGFIDINGKTVLKLIPQGSSWEVKDKFGFSSEPMNNTYIGISNEGQNFFIHCIDANYNSDICEPIPYSDSNLYDAYGEMEKYENGEKANPSYSEYHSDFFSENPEFTPDFNRNIKDDRFNAERFVKNKTKF